MYQRGLLKGIKYTVGFLGYVRTTEINIGEENNIILNYMKDFPEDMLLPPQVRELNRPGTSGDFIG